MRKYFLEWNVAVCVLKKNRFLDIRETSSIFSALQMSRAFGTTRTSTFQETAETSKPDNGNTETALN